jgi:hypothetical protein
MKSSGFDPAGPAPEMPKAAFAAFVGPFLSTPKPVGLLRGTQLLW